VCKVKGVVTIYSVEIIMEQWEKPSNWNAYRRSSDVIFNVYTR